jgi:dCMP deaminase
MITDQERILGELRAALKIATLSRDPSDKVGCVVYKDNGRTFVSAGYNNFPMGVKETKERLLDKEFKRSVMIHAEMDAIFNAKRSLQKSTFFITHSPCAACASSIINAKVSQVVTIEYENNPLSEYWDKSIQIGRLIMEEAGIKCMTIPYEKIISKT